MHRNKVLKCVLIDELFECVGKNAFASYIWQDENSSREKSHCHKSPIWKNTMSLWTALVCINTTVFICSTSDTIHNIRQKAKLQVFLCGLAIQVVIKWILIV